MSTITSQITSLTIVYSTVYSDVVQRKHQSSVSLVFVWGVHRGPVTRKMFPFDDVIMVQTFFLLNETAVEVRTWMSNHIPMLYIDVITKPCPNFDAGKANSARTRSHRTLQWRHNEHDCVSNHQPHYCLPNRLFTRRSKKTSKLRVTGLCVGNSPVTGEFPAQRASNAGNASIWWRQHREVLPGMVIDGLAQKYFSHGLGGDYRYW